MEDELKGIDYMLSPMTELVKHPDFSLSAQRKISAICNMTSAQLEELNVGGNDID